MAARKEWFGSFVLGGGGSLHFLKVYLVWGAESLVVYRNHGF